jgi:tetratricopeptide (TPR) repeat protein
MTANTAQRLALYQKLVSLPPPQFEQVLFSLKPPSGNVPPSQTAQGDRVSALLTWAESNIGCGLDQVEATYTLVIDPEAANRPPAPVFNLPFPRNPFFTGREDQLEKIHAALTSRGRAALSGLGGIGKTQTALEYAYRHQSEYDHVFWVRAEQETDLITGYVALAKALQIPGHQQDDQQAIAALMKQWLATHDGWLLVLDNADNLPQLRSYLPTMNGHILLTTRAQALGDLATKDEVTHIDHMDANEGALLLLRRAKAIADDADLTTASDSDQTLAQTLSTEMDGLPLALDQAGAYIEEQMLSLEEYLELFRTEKAELLMERGKLSPDHPSVSATFKLAFEKVAAASATAAALVEACAFLAPDAIPEEIFREGAEAFDPPLRTLAESKLALSQAIGEAARFSLISRNPQTKTLTIHRLVQEVLRAAMDDNSQRQWAEQVVEAVTTVFPEAQFENWVQCDRLIAQAQATIQLIAHYGLASETAALLLSRTGSYYNSQGRYGDAEPLYLEALAMRKQLLGEAHPSVAASLNNLAVLYEKQGRYEEAEPLYLEALAMDQRLLGEAHPDIAASLSNLAALYCFQGRYEAAEPLYLEALAMRKRLLGEAHPNVANSLNNLAGLYEAQGRYADAEPLYLEALAMMKRLLGEVHPDVATSLNNLAELYRSQGRYEEAEPLYLEALAMDQRLLGEAHPDIAASLNNLALLYQAQGRYGDAEPLYLEALAMRKQLLGEAHPNVANSLFSLGALRYEQSRYGEAQTLLLQAQPICLTSLGPNHPHTQALQRWINRTQSALDSEPL